MSYTKEDLTGKKFNKLTALYPVNTQSKHRSIIWRFLCDCGQEKNIRGSNVKCGTTKTCGCLIEKRQQEIGKIYNNCKIIEVRRDNKKTIAKVECNCGKFFETLLNNIKKGNTKSCRCTTYLPPGIAAKNNLLYHLKIRSIQRGYQWLLTDEQFFNLINKNCYYCGIEPLQMYKPKNYNGAYFYNGIDRINSNDNYQINNCVSCCKSCNGLKGTLTSEQFAIKIQRIINNKNNLNNLKFYSKDIYKETHIKHLYSQIKAHAKYEKHGWNLTFEDFKNIIFKHCNYCYIEPTNIFTNKYTQIFYNGIDRINNYLNYEINNCVPCCKECNTAKSNLPLEQFNENLERLVKYNSK